MIARSNNIASKIDYLDSRFPEARARIALFRGRPVAGRGQVYSDVLIVKEIDRICSSLNVVVGSSLPTSQRLVCADGSQLSLSYFDILAWLELSPPTIATKRTLVQHIHTVHNVLYTEREHGGLSTEEERVFDQLVVFERVNIDGGLLPLPDSAFCPPLTSAQCYAAKVKRMPFQNILQGLRRKYINAINM